MQPPNLEVGYSQFAQVSIAIRKWRLHKMLNVMQTGVIDCYHRKTHQFTTVIVKQPGRFPADCNKFNRMPIVLFASDMSTTGSRTGWPPTNHEILTACLAPVFASILR